MEVIKHLTDKSPSQRLDALKAKPDDDRPTAIRALMSEEALRGFIYDKTAIERIKTVFDTIAARPIAGTVLGALKATEQSWPSDKLRFSKLIKAQHEYMLSQHVEVAKRFGEDYLEEGYNHPQIQTQSFIQQAPILIRFIDSHYSMIKHCPRKEDWVEGVCGGMTLDFLCLLNQFCMEHHVPITESVLRAVASEFSIGGSDRVVMLQALQLHSTLVGVFEEEQMSRFVGESPSIEALENGVYKVCVNSSDDRFLEGSHTMTLIVTTESNVMSEAKEKKCYLFDPNYGLVKVNNHTFENWLKSYLQEETSYTLCPCFCDLDKAHSKMFREHHYE